MKNLVEHFFRHEYGHLVAVLTQKVGFDHLQDIEDAVQNALTTALETWTQTGTPKKPKAWLFKVASNNIIGTLRQNNRRSEILEENLHNFVDKQNLESVLSDEFKDGILKWLFICCHPSIAIESQLVFALKTLCGFNIKEISIRLFLSEANVYKRYSRARIFLQKLSNKLPNLTKIEYASRLKAVNKVIYLLFTEGYLSSHLNYAIRSEMCEDAMRLNEILIENKMGTDAESSALKSLMHLHYARLPARVNNANELLLLEKQNRKLWDKNQINQGLYWLSKASVGNKFSRYHAEAGIAIEHCLAPSFEQTNWKNIVKCYDLLEKVSPSALHRLNKAVAIGQWQGAGVGLSELESQEIPKWLKNSYQYQAVLSDLNRRIGNHHKAVIFAKTAISLAPTPAIKNSLTVRLLSNNSI